MKKINVIDLFCGAGGLSLGFEKAGFNTVFAVENNPIYAKTFMSNFTKTEVFVGNIQSIDESEIRKLIDKHVDVIIGGPPCQGFSKAGNIGRMFLDDPRNKLFNEYLRFVDIVNPKMFLIENVAALLNHNKGKTLEEIISKIASLGYNVKFKVLNAVNYDVPQERRRIFIVGFKDNINFEFPKEHKRIISIKEAIGDLPKLNSGEKSDVYLHTSMNHSAQMLEKMSYVRDGGNRLDIPLELRPKSGDIRKYIRYDSNKPSFCVTGDMRKIFHYSQNRALTCRELARLQTFPDDYIFCGNSIQIQQQIGNAVPCKLAYYVAKEIRRSLLDEQISKN